MTNFESKRILLILKIPISTCLRIVSTLMNLAGLKFLIILYSVLHVFLLAVKLFVFS